MSNELMNGSKKRNKEEHMGSGTPLTDLGRSSRRKRGRAMRLASLSSLTGLLALASLPAQAALITINETIDISGYTSGAGLIVPTISHIIASGDRVDMTLNFSAGQALKIGDGIESFHTGLFAIGAPNDFTIENIIVNFLGFSGTESASSTLTSVGQASVNSYMGPDFYGFLSAGQSIQFTGYNVTYDVTRLGTNPNIYSNIWFRQDSRDLTVVSVPVAEAVPEPGALSLLAMGLAGLAVAQRRKAGSRRSAYPA